MVRCAHWLALAAFTALSAEACSSGSRNGDAGDSGAPADAWDRTIHDAASHDGTTPHDTGAQDTVGGDTGVRDGGVLDTRAGDVAMTHDTGTADTSAPDVQDVVAGDGAVITPGNPGPSDVQFTIDSTRNAHAISSYIYGLNAPDWTMNTGVTFTRFGGNRVTAYNWENNASNAGSDYNFENDNYLCSDAGCTAPGETVRRIVAAAQAHHAASVIAVPMAGYCAADTSPPGDVRNSGSNYLTTRFRQSIPQKGAAFSLTPDLTDAYVYQDEFVNWLETTFPNSRATPDQAVFYELDNEPDLWSSTHAEIHPDPTLYSEMVSKSTALSTAIKAVAPDTLVFGFVSYGWAGYYTLQSAPDANGRVFLDFFLDSMASASLTAGQRLLDVLDLHWYPEATGGGVRIIMDSNDPTTEAQIIAARLQAPRSLWDPNYIETSWITQCCSNGAIELIPRLMGEIGAHDPGTKLAFSEYNYGGGAMISGGIAEADVLGIFGREGLFAATEWPMASDESFIVGGLEMFRNFDGAGGAFGDTSIAASTTDVASTSVYASVNAADPAQMIVVAINKTAGTLNAGIQVTHTVAFSHAHVDTLTAASATPQAQADVAITATNAFVYPMPAYSVSTLVLVP